MKFDSIIEFIDSCGDNYVCSVGMQASELTSFRIGGVVALTVYPENKGALCALLQYLRGRGVKYDVLGNGTNVLVSDDGYDGVLVITSKLDDIVIDGNIMTASCGRGITSCASAAARAGLGGLEFAYGIPGSVGGAVTMNAGAYGGEIADIIVSADVYDGDSDSIITLGRDELSLAYRDSVIRHKPMTVLSASFELHPGDQDAILAEMNDYMQRRRDKQPLEFPSAGSVFKRYPGYFTAQLIDEAGLKGKRIGGAEVSEKHAGFIVNRGGATAADVKALIELITDEIEKRHSIKIERELIYLS